MDRVSPTRSSLQVSASHLPGILLPVISQSYIVWNLTFATIFLGTR